MTRFSANVNSNGSDKAKSENTDVSWEVIRSYEYRQNSLIKVISLHVIKFSDHENDLSDDQIDNCNIIARVIVSRECVFFSKSISIDILHGVLSRKFVSKRKNYAYRLQELYKELCKISNTELPQKIEEGFLAEYHSVVEMFKK